MMFLKPAPIRLVITAVLLLIAYGGYIQSEVFSERDPSQPALPLAGFFEPIPYLWELWVVLLAPLAVTLRLFHLQRPFDSGPIWFFWAFHLLYLYFLSYLIVRSWNRLTRHRASYAPDSTSS